MARNSSVVAGVVPSFVGTAPERRRVVEWVFRIAVAMEFVGHGAFGITTKAAWVPYFGLFGIPDDWAWRLMPLVGALDITVGLLTLVVPIRAVLLHMAVWGLMTASLRPLSGEGVWELLERGYNYGVPLAFLVLAGAPTTLRAWIGRVDLRPTPERRRAAAMTLRWAIGLCLIGHGGIALFTHTRWTVYVEALGVSPASAVTALHAVGGFELVLGAAVLVAPFDALLVFVCLWKVASEALRISVGEPLWEFIERGGAYAAPLLLILLQRWPRARLAG